jgi:endo-1,4-beta-xylanase
MPTRRDVLRAAAHGALWSPALAGLARATTPIEPLRQLAAERGILFGTYIHAGYLGHSEAYEAMVVREAALIVSSALHWDEIAPAPDRTDFAEIDKVESWAQSHQLGLRGHALLWWRAAPRWFADLPSRDMAVKAVEGHIAAMCRHFGGRLQSWDVVNEAIKVNDGRADRLRRCVFIDKIGPDYVDIAFRAARANDPKTPLVYNEFDLELDIPEQAEKRRALLDMIDGFKKRGTPIDAVGLQSHLSTEGMAHFDEKIFSGFLHDLADRGLKILLTENDVVDRSAPSDIIERDEAVAAAYRRYLDVALANPAVKTLVNWGLTDRDSWIDTKNPETRRKDGQPPRPLPFDDAFRPKPAYFAVADALAHAPLR